MEGFLERIVGGKKRRLLEGKQYSPREVVEIFKRREGRSNPLLPSLKYLSGPNIIAEIKRASPSRGKLIEGSFLPYLEEYEAGEAVAISVVTEEDYFKGSLEMFQEVRKFTSLPLLRKDFVIEETQIYESAQWGADALLLIARILSRERLQRFVYLCTLLNLVPWVEVHDEKDVEKALEAGAPLLGINNRNLATFQVAIEISERLRREVPPSIPVVAESGIKNRADIEKLMDKGINNFLIGETLLASLHPAEKLKELQGGTKVAQS